MKDVLITIGSLDLVNRWRNTALEKVVILAFFKSSAEYFDGPVLFSVKSISERLYGKEGLEEEFMNRTREDINWLVEHEYIEVTKCKEYDRPVYFANPTYKDECESVWDEYEYEELERREQEQLEKMEQEYNEETVA